MVLHFYLGLPLTDVASALDIPVGTAKSRLNRGLADMRASINGDPDGRPSPAAGGQPA